MPEKISGSVARILNRRELVINRGSDDGVLEGMKFAVLNPRGAEINDPETGEILGSVETPKVLVKTVRVEPKLSVARTFQVHRKVTGGGLGLYDMFQPRRVVQEPETLETTEETYQEELDEEDSYVKTGDPVVQIIGDEYIMVGKKPASD